MHPQAPSPFTVLRPAAILAGVFLACLSLPATANMAPTAPTVPAEAVQAHEAVFMWQKPEDYRKVHDYLVYVNGRPFETARTNAKRLSELAAYRKAFYARAAGARQVQVDLHAVTLDRLLPDTDYHLAVRAMDARGRLSALSPSILIHTPKEGPRCDIREHGARPDGQTLDTQAIQTTIDNCPAGGTVVIPAGRYVSGALFLKSHMTLEIQHGATLLGSTRPQDYPLDKSYLLYPYATDRRPPSLLNAYDPTGHGAEFEDIRIVGQGVVDGNGWKQAETGLKDETGRAAFHFIKGNRNTVDKAGLLAANQVAAARAEGMDKARSYSVRRSSMLTIQHAKDIFISGIHFRNPAYHGLMLLDARNVTVRSVRVETWDGNNGDGIELGNSQNVSVSDSYFDTGDDGVNFAAGMGADAASQPPMEKAWIFDNYMRHGHGGVVFGSHTGAWIQDVLTEDNIMNGTNVGFRAKSNQLNGGGGRRLVFRDNAMRNIPDHGIILTLAYADNNQVIAFKPAPTSGLFQNIQIRHNSLEYTPDWISDPARQNNDGGNKAAKTDALQISGNPEHGILHKDVVVDDLLLINAGPIRINGLQNGLLRNIRYEGYRGTGPALTTDNAPGLKLEDLKLPRS